MVYIGKTFNLWYLVIDQMEDICSYYVHDKKDVRNINYSYFVGVYILFKHNKNYF